MLHHDQLPVEEEKNNPLQEDLERVELSDHEKCIKSKTELSSQQVVTLQCEFQEVQQMGQPKGCNLCSCASNGKGE